MLRINLLPAYIAERKKTRNAIIANSALFAIVLGGMLYWNFGLKVPEVQAEDQKAADEQVIADRVNKIVSDTSQLRQQIAPLQDKVNFVKQVRFHNEVRQIIFRKAAKYTYKEVEYNQMAVTGNTLSITGYVKKLSDIGRTYLTFYGNPDVTAVSIAGMPGYPTAEQQQNQNGANINQQRVRPAYPIQLTATLTRSVAPPALPASLNASATGGGGGAAAAVPPPAAAGPPADDAGGGAAATP